MIENVEYKGKWRLPNSKKEISGDLRFSPKDGISLELNGSFRLDFLDQSNESLILGKTNKGNITLVENRFQSSGHSNQITIDVYNPRVIFLGKHFNSINDIRFREVTFRLFNLFDWCNIHGLRLNLSTLSKFSVDYQEPPDVEFSLHEKCDGRIRFYSPLRTENPNNKINLSEECDISLVYKEKTHFKDILNDIFIFQKFITLSTFEQSYPLTIIFSDDDYFVQNEKFKKNLNIHCIYKNPLFDEKYEVRNSNESLIRFQDIREDFPKLIWNWFENYKKIEPPFILLMKYFYDRDTFSTEKFMDIVRGLETFHRMTSDKLKFSELEYNNKKRTILETVDLSEKDKLWLNDLLNYSNELSLKNRLKDLINNHSNKYIQKKVVNIKRFCQSVVDTRNYNTHFDPKLKDKSLKDKDLFDVTQILTGLLISSVFGQIGIDDSIFEERMDKLLY
jgi:hypothetical protein